MASKKLKKALMAGVVGALGARALSQAGEMKEFLKTEGGDKAKVNYITKKAKPIKKTFMGKVKDAVNVYKEKGFKTPPGLNATSKKRGTLAGNYRGAFDYFDMNTGGQATKMVKARGGKLVNLKPTKMS